MDKKIIYALIVGIVMYLLLIYLAYVQRDLTGSQLVLMLATPFVVGFLSGGVKKGLVIGFGVSFVMLLLEVMVIQWGAFTDPNVVMAIIVMMVLPFALISAGGGAAGGCLCRRIFKKLDTKTATHFAFEISFKNCTLLLERVYKSPNFFRQMLK